MRYAKALRKEREKIEQQRKCIEWCIARNRSVIRQCLKAKYSETIKMPKERIQKALEKAIRDLQCNQDELKILLLVYGDKNG